MPIPKEFKDKAFMVIEDQMSLIEFEAWLYGSEALLNEIGEDVVLEAYSFNYKQHGAKAEFKKALFQYFNIDEFLLWKVKANLLDIAAGKNDRDRILYDFWCLGEDGYTFLQPIGYYRYYIDDAEYAGNTEDVLDELKHESEKLLDSIVEQERADSGFKLCNFRGPNQPQGEPLTLAYRWWNFWK